MMEKEEGPRASSQKDQKRLMELPPIIQGNMQLILEERENVKDLNKTKSRKPFSKSKVVPVGQWKAERKQEKASTQKYPYSDNQEEEKGTTEKDKQDILTLKDGDDSIMFTSSKKDSIYPLDLGTQGNRIIIETEPNTEDQPYNRTTSRKAYSFILVIAVILLVVVVCLIGYIIFLQRKNTDYIEKNSELETEMKYFDECKEKEKIYSNRLDNIIHILNNCSNALISCSNSSDPCTDLRSNYTDLNNKYTLLVEENSKLKNDLKEIQENYDKHQTNERYNMKKDFVIYQEKCSKYAFLRMIESEQVEDPREPTAETPALLGFVVVDDLNKSLQEYKWTESGNTYEITESYMSTMDHPTRGERNTRGIYVLNHWASGDIIIYDLASFETPSVNLTQSGEGGWGNCGFLEDDIIVCASRSTGDIFTYNLTNNYHPQQIVANNPSENGYTTLLVTNDKKILTSWDGCIYIYASDGIYLGKSDSSRTNYMFQMKELRPNIIVAVEQDYVHLHDISDPENPIVENILNFAYTSIWYFTVEVLSVGTGDFALGGNAYDYISNGYVELFHLDEDNTTLQPIPKKRWICDNYCIISIIREIQVGVLIFGGNINCEYICTWEYALTPHKGPTCFHLEGMDIYDLIALP